MNPNQVLVKTGKGRDEIKARSITLSQHARNLLIATDGQKSCGQLAQMYSKIPHVDAVLDELAALGLVEPQGSSSKAAGDGAAQKLRSAIDYLTESANENLGFGGFTFTLKAGRCASIEDVKESIIPCRYCRSLAST